MRTSEVSEPLRAAGVTADDVYRISRHDIDKMNGNKAAQKEQLLALVVKRIHKVHGKAAVKNILEGLFHIVRGVPAGIGGESRLALQSFTSWLLHHPTNTQLAEIHRGMAGMHYGVSVSYIGGEPRLVEWSNVYPAESISLLNTPWTRADCGQLYGHPERPLTHEEFHRWWRAATVQSLKHYHKYQDWRIERAEAADREKVSDCVTRLLTNDSYDPERPTTLEQTCGGYLDSVAYDAAAQQKVSDCIDRIPRKDKESQEHLAKAFAASQACAAGPNAMPPAAKFGDKTRQPADCFDKKTGEQIVGYRFIYEMATGPDILQRLLLRVFRLGLRPPCLVRNLMNDFHLVHPQSDGGAETFSNQSRAA